MSINPFANRKHILIKGTAKSADGSKEITYVRLVRSFDFLDLDRTRNKEEIVAQFDNYESVFTLLRETEKIAPEYRIITHPYFWDLMMHELGLPFAGVFFVEEGSKDSKHRFSIKNRKG